MGMERRQERHPFDPGRCLESLTLDPTTLHGSCIPGTKVLVRTTKAGRGIINPNRKRSLVGKRSVPRVTRRGMLDVRAQSCARKPNSGGLDDEMLNGIRLAPERV